MEQLLSVGKCHSPTELAYETPGGSWAYPNASICQGSGAFSGFGLEMGGARGCLQHLSARIHTHRHFSVVSGTRVGLGRDNTFGDQR